MVDLVKNLLGADYDPVVAISLFNTIFNISGAILFAPLIGVFTKFIQRILPDRTYSHELAIEKLVDEVPIEASLTALQTDAIYLIRKVFDLNMYIFGVDNKYISDSGLAEDKSDHNISSYHDQYTYIKQIEDKLYKYVLALDQVKLNTKTSQKIQDLHKGINNAVYAAKFLKDIAHNMKDMMEADNPVIRDYFQRNQTAIVNIYNMLGDMIQDGVSESEMQQFKDILADYDKGDNQFVANMQSSEILKTLADLELSSLRHTHRYLCLSIQHLLAAINFVLLSPNQRIDIDKYDDDIL